MHGMTESTIFYKFHGIRGERNVTIIAFSGCHHVVFGDFVFLVCLGHHRSAS